jgi:hypothetical protein
MLRQPKLGVERVMTPQIETNHHVDKLATAVVNRRWQFFLLLILDVGRPFAFLMGQFLWVAQPALSLFWSPPAIGRWAALLEQPDQLDQLITRLEESQS